MLISYISSALVPSRNANSIHVMKMCQAFAKNGNDVSLFVRKINDFDDIYSYYGVDRNFEVLERKFRKFPVKYEKYFSGIWAAFKSHKLKADLVYGRNLTGCFVSALLGLNVVFESHSPVSNSGRNQETIFRKLIKSSRFKKLVVITHSLKKYYENVYPELAGRIFVAPDAADPLPESIRMNGQSLVKSKKIKIGYIGHLYKGRGIDLIVELAKVLPDADFHLIGGTQPDIEFWKKETAKFNNIIFHGFLPPSNIDKYKIAFDILLAPYQEEVIVSDNKSDTSKWMSPLKIFEYMATKKPIVCSNLPVLREILEHERNAFLCSPSDIEEWKQTLERLISDPELRIKLGCAAYSDFIDNYTWEIRAKKIIDSIIHE
jgi:glycosyltransferase involved in cell wall biosynthesis